MHENHTPNLGRREQADPAPPPPPGRTFNREAAEVAGLSPAEFNRRVRQKRRVLLDTLSGLIPLMTAEYLLFVRAGGLVPEILNGRLPAREAGPPVRYLIDAADLRAFADELEGRVEFYRTRRRRRYEEGFVQHVATKFGVEDAARLRARFHSMRRAGER